MAMLALFVPPDDGAALAGAVRRILDDGALAARLRHGAAEYAAEFAWSAIAAQTLAFYAALGGSSERANDPIGSVATARAIMATLTERTAAATTPPRARPSRAWMRGEAIPLVFLALLTLLGAVMRRYHLGQQGLWFDEADIVMRARQPLPELLRNFIHPGENGPLYTLGLAGWTRLFGTSEVAVRLPSAIAGTLAIPAMYALGRMLRGPRLGLIAAALLTVSPYAHWYAQDAKMYSLLVLLTIVTTVLLLTAVRRGGALWIAYGVAAAVTLGVHATFLLVLVAHAVIAASLWRSWLRDATGTAADALARPAHWCCRSAAPHLGHHLCHSERSNVAGEGDTMGDPPADARRIQRHPSG